MAWGVSRALGLAAFAVSLMLILGHADADVSASTSKSWDRLQANQDAVFLISHEGMAFTEIKLTLKSMTDNVYIELNALTDNDTLIEAPAPGEVYQYIRAIPTNIQAGNLEKASIRFRVNKTWISGSSIKDETIALYSYGASWSGLETIPVSGDENYAYYMAQVPRFQLFAVSGEKAPAGLLCSPGGTKCAANDLYLCAPDGMSWSPLENCTYGCDGGAGACRQWSCPECPEPEPAKACSPGEQKCSGSELRQCNPGGTGWEAVKNCPSGCILCRQEEAQACSDLPYLAAILALIIAVVALGAYLGLHK